MLLQQASSIAHTQSACRSMSCVTASVSGAFVELGAAQ
jgi:hypothetical protein